MFKDDKGQVIRGGTKIRDLQSGLGTRGNKLILVSAPRPNASLQVVRVRDESVSALARNSAETNKVCDYQPIYAHWFGREMLSAYESAKLQIKEERYPITIKIDGDTYEIDEGSLKMVTSAIKTATSLYTDDNDNVGRRGFSVFF